MAQGRPLSLESSSESSLSSSDATPSETAFRAAAATSDFAAPCRASTSSTVGGVMEWAKIQAEPRWQNPEDPGINEGKKRSVHESGKCAVARMCPFAPNRRSERTFDPKLAADQLALVELTDGLFTLPPCSLSCELLALQSLMLAWLEGSDRAFGLCFIQLRTLSTPVPPSFLPARAAHRERSGSCPIEGSLPASGRTCKGSVEPESA